MARERSHRVIRDRPTRGGDLPAVGEAPWSHCSRPHPRAVTASDRYRYPVARAWGSVSSHACYIALHYYTQLCIDACFNELAQKSHAKIHENTISTTYTHIRPGLGFNHMRHRTYVDDVLGFWTPGLLRSSASIRKYA